jgi:hypothetical protein
MKKIGLMFVWGMVGLCSAGLYAKFEQEQIEIETQLQQRIEGILAKTLPPNSYLVTVKVEMENREKTTAKGTTTAKRGGGHSLLGQNQYVLPGVPQKKEFVPPQESMTETTVNAISPETLVKRILITILVSPDVSPDQIRAIREVISSSIPFNPLRGDEMDIQSSLLLNKRTAESPGSMAAMRLDSAGGGKGLWGSVTEGWNAPLLFLLGAICTAGILFMGFLFGPVRAFLNRLLTVLPRVGEQAAYTVSNAPSKNVPGNLAQLDSMSLGANGNTPIGFRSEDSTRPFHFLREDQVHKLPILFKGMPASQCALVLAYLPAGWASRVIGVLDAGAQSAIMRELSRDREVPPQEVRELEEQVKSKIPYLVGGVDWIESVYQLTQPQTQRALLGTLNQQAPELAQALRRKTFFFEDLLIVTPGALRLVIQEVGFPTAALAMRDEKPEAREALLKRLPIAMREILQQELELSLDDKTAIAEAKFRLSEIGRRLLSEGRITFPEGERRG